MPISDNHRCIFIHIPKCAGTSIEFILGMHGDVDHVGVRAYDSNQHKGDNFFGQMQQHFTLAQIQERIDAERFSNYSKFSFVRNPWSRLVSFAAWRGGKWTRGEQLTIDEFGKFIRSLYKQWKNDKKLGVLAQQASFLRDAKGEIRLDFIGHTESVEDDWKKARAILYNNSHLPSKLPQRMKSHHTHYRYYYDKESADIVDEIYSDDIKLFGYKF